MKSRSTFRSHPGKSQKAFKPPIITRELPPRMLQAPKGLQIMCPFCRPAHPIVPGQASPCGTELKVTAVQTVIPARTANDQGLRCMKCHEVGKGPMVRSGGGYVHQEDCVPGTTVLTQPPPNSKTAERVYRLKPGWWKKFMEKRYGKARCVKEIDVDGNETGKILSYFFQKV